MKTINDSFIFVAMSTTDCRPDPNRGVVQVARDLVSVSPDPRAVEIWSGSGDPGVRDAQVYGFPPPIFVVVPGFGLAVARDRVASTSLRSLGTYTYFLHDMFWGDAAGNVGPMSDEVFGVPIGNTPPSASPSVAGTLRVGRTVTLNANASDPDGGAMTFAWSITARPAGSTSALSGASSASPTLHLGNKHDIGHWNAHVDVVDGQGEVKHFDLPFDVPNQPPTLNLAGPTPIDALQHIHLDATPALDDDGETITWVWDVVSSPPGASQGQQSNFGTGPTLDLPTGPHDIGTWEFRCTATDEHSASVSRNITITVRAVPPRIEISPTSVTVHPGDTIQFADTVANDAYGAPLQYRWDLIQVPTGAGVGLTSSYATGPSILLPVTRASAGTWKWRLTVTDQVNQTATEVVRALVDVPPQAHILGPDQTGNLSLALDLDGSTSSDPDSPAAGPDFGHQHSEPVEVSGGVVGYRWSVLEVPEDLYGRITPGSTEDALHANGSGPTLHVEAGRLRPGSWLFELRVTDAEGNSDTTTHRVEVLDEGLPPLAVLDAPRLHTVSLDGTVAANITVDGSNSFDLDNLIGASRSPGLGITNYDWEITSAPPACTTLPSLTDGASATTATLYSAGALVTPDCQGTYVVSLTVTDDDTPARHGTQSTNVLIGNCAGAVCIDSPTQAAPARIKFSNRTDVLVLYHLNSLLYDDPQFAAGLRLRLSIFHEDHPGTPVFSNAWDVDMLPTDRGRFLSVHWSGFDSTGARPLPGKYHVLLDVLGPGGAPSGYSATELRSIWIQTINVAVAPATERYASADGLRDGTDTLQVGYTVTGQLPGELGYDEIRYKVFNHTTHAQVWEGSATGPLTGSFAWNGNVGGSTFIGPGEYDLQLEAREAGATLGVSSLHQFTVYRLSLTPASGAVTSTPPGLFAYVNNDDDDHNEVSDLNEAAPGENDLSDVAVRVEPALAGRVTLESTDPVAPFKLWNDGAKTSEYALPAAFDTPGTPVPGHVFVEGRSPASTGLRIRMHTADGFDLMPKSIALTLVGVELVQDTNGDHAVGAGDTVVHSVHIGRWDGGYDPVTFAVRNSADPNNFVEQDPARFYLRVSDPSGDTNHAAIDSVQARVGTITAGGATDDILTNQTLQETGVNTGVFVSLSQLLTSADIPPSDDAFAAFGTGGPVMDDLAGDRTHRTVSIDGAARIVYGPVGAPLATTQEAPVCTRAPEERRRAELRAVIFNEPYHDTGYDDDGNPATPLVGAGNLRFDFTDANMNGAHDAGEPSEEFIDLSSGAAVYAHAGSRGPITTPAYVDAQIARANVAWQQACIRFVLVGAPVIADAPRNGLGADILGDGTFEFLNALGAPEDDLQRLFAAYAPGAPIDVVQVFFVAPIAGANAATAPPLLADPTLGEHTFILMTPNLAIDFRTLAHEFGHALLNDYDAANLQTIFFPASMTFHDNALNTYRRLTAPTIATARSVRAAGTVAPGSGNRILKAP